MGAVFNIVAMRCIQMVTRYRYHLSSPRLNRTLVLEATNSAIVTITDGLGDNQSPSTEAISSFDVISIIFVREKRRSTIFWCLDNNLRVSLLHAECLRDHR